MNMFTCIVSNFKSKIPHLRGVWILVHNAETWMQMKDMLADMTNELSFQKTQKILKMIKILAHKNGFSKCLH